MFSTARRLTCCRFDEKSMRHVVGRRRKQDLQKREEDLGDQSQTASGNLFLLKWKTNEFLPVYDRECLLRIFFSLYFCGAVA